MGKDVTTFIDGLLSLWRDTQPDAQLPTRRAFRPETNLRPYLGNLLIVSVEHDPMRFKVTLIGDRIVDLDGRNITGRYLDQAILPSALESFLKPYEVSVRDRCAVLRKVYFTPLGAATMSQLYLPLSEDGSRVTHVLVGMAFSDWEDPLKKEKMLDMSERGFVEHGELQTFQRTIAV